MLAEIYMLRLEAAARAAKETARFIPITLPVVKASRRRRFSVQTISEASSLCLPRLRPMD
jgi:hypothetical protein